MANINVAELQIIGSNLFQDSESFLHELNYLDSVSIFAGKADDGFSNNLEVVLNYGEKILEFSLITYGIHAVVNVVQSYSDPDIHL
jgi:hypothetical protein